MKQRIEIYASSVKVNGTAATSSFTSDPIEIKENTYWSLSCWFSSLTYTGNAPEITIEVSNNTDSDSFRKLTGAVNIPLPEFFERSTAEWKYIRLIYTPKGATGGTKSFDLILGK